MADMVRTTEVAAEVISVSPASAVWSTFTALEIIALRYITATVTLSAIATASFSGSLVTVGSATASAAASATISGTLLTGSEGWGIPMN